MKLIYQADESDSEFMVAFEEYAAAFCFDYFVGGQSLAGKIFINYHDTSSNRARIAEIALFLSDIFPGLMSLDHKHNLIQINGFSRRMSNINADRSPKASFILRPSKRDNNYIKCSWDNFLFVSCIVFKPWHYVDYYEGVSFFEPLSKSTAHSVIRRIPSARFQEMCSWRRPYPALLEPASVVKFPIDAVFTWVDGEDPMWQEKKLQYEKHNIKARASSPQRFKSRDELLYSLRSLELYASWINHIYIVTDRQIPAWLDTSKMAGRVTLVDHTDLMPPDHLPCFNSSAIETYLHRIEGLSEHFLYLNDDFLFHSQVFPEDFFLSNGQLKCFPSNQRAEPFIIDEDSEEYIQADKNALSLITRTFGSSRNEIMRHVPYPSKRSLLTELEIKFEAAFMQARKNRFRSSSDLRPIAFMQYHYGYHKGLVIYEDIFASEYIRLSRKDLQIKLNELSLNSEIKTFCINDAGEGDGEFVNRTLSDFLETSYPCSLAYENISYAQ